MIGTVRFPPPGRHPVLRDPAPGALAFLFATSLIAIVRVLILFIFIERYLIGGLTAGSVK